ncbi:MAG: TonB-dependent receptor [Desulfobacteria bacterium]|jgi:outer membrane receptor for ferrienterochelin and colicins
MRKGLKGLMRFMGSICLFGSVTLLISITAQAQEKEAKLEEIVVTATKTPHTLEDVPVETILVTKEDIKESNAKNVSELLRDIHGFYIQGENVPGSSAYRSKLRGLDFDKGYGLILINGERVLGGGMGEYGISLNQIPVDMIEKIEVVKGPASVLYGSDAIAGVVNIITKPIPEKPMFTVSGGYGSYDTSLFNVGYGQKINKFGFLISAQRETSERGRYGATEDDFKGEYVLSKLSYDFSDNVNFSLGINHDDLKWEYQTEEKLRFSPSLEIALPDASFLKLKGYFNRLDMDSFSPGYTRRFGDITYTQTEVQYTKPFGKSQLITAGGEYLLRDIDASFAEKSDTFQSLYLQDEIMLKPFSIVIGGRVDDYSLYGTEFNPKMSLMWKVAENTRLRASIGRAFKSPTIRQLYVSFKHGNWWNKPNEDLNPEVSWGYSTGIEHIFSKKLSANVSLFRNDIKDIIVAVDTSETIEGTPVRTWNNVSKAFTQGAELGIKAVVMDNLLLNLGYTYLDTENEDTKKELPYNPHHTASIGLDYEIKPWDTSFHWRTNYISEGYTDEANTKKTGSYYISNLKIIKDITKNISFSMDVDNIFESDYGEPDKEWLGRVIFGKLTIKIWR